MAGVVISGAQAGLHTRWLPVQEPSSRAPWHSRPGRAFTRRVQTPQRALLPACQPGARLPAGEARAAPSNFPPLGVWTRTFCSLLPTSVEQRLPLRSSRAHGHAVATCNVEPRGTPSEPADRGRVAGARRGSSADSVPQSSPRRPAQARCLGQTAGVQLSCKVPCCSVTRAASPGVSLLCRAGERSSASKSLSTLAILGGKHPVTEWIYLESFESHTIEFTCS